MIVAASAPGIVERAVSLARRGGRVMLFAQTSKEERFSLDGQSVCAEDRTVFGSYSACADLQREAASIVWDPEFPVDRLVTHRVALEEFQNGMALAREPRNGALKVIVRP